MVVQVSKSSVRANIYKNFYDLINSITSLSGKVYPKYNDKVRDSEDDYPCVILHPANTPHPENLTNKKGIVSGTILAEVFATNDKDADAYADLIDNKIETNKFTLSSNGLRRVMLEDEDDDIDVRGNIRGFVKQLTFSFIFYYSKDGGF